MDWGGELNQMHSSIPGKQTGVLLTLRRQPFDETASEDIDGRRHGLRHLWTLDRL